MVLKSSLQVTVDFIPKISAEKARGHGWAAEGVTHIYSFEKTYVFYITHTKDLYKQQNG